MRGVIHPLHNFTFTLIFFSKTRYRFHNQKFTVQFRRVALQVGRCVTVSVHRVCKHPAVNYQDHNTVA